MTFSSNSTDEPFANDAGITRSVVSDEDPYGLLDDLMVVVEALCAIWPERRAFVESDKMLL
jgi:hypothetical protein